MTDDQGKSWLRSRSIDRADSVGPIAVRNAFRLEADWIARQPN